LGDSGQVVGILAEFGQIKVRVRLDRRRNVLFRLCGSLFALSNAG
jgi:hypothetical protein